MWFSRWRTQRLLRQKRIPIGLWNRVVEDALKHHHLDAQALNQLRDFASLFLHYKVINGAGGLEVDDYMRTVIAAVACLLILKLDLDYFNGWLEIIIYADSFVVQREVQDAIGLVSEQRTALRGEAWGKGPVVLSWEDAISGSRPHNESANVILHEFAHKLDMLNGAANGMPPLHQDMHRQDWTDTFTRAFDELQTQIERQHRTHIDPYGAENPAEFFAVVSEEFFESPARLHKSNPAVYEQLRSFYRQDPLQRFS